MRARCPACCRAGLPATANITPLTELVAAKIAGGDPAQIFTNFDAAARQKLNGAAVRSAIEAVATSLSEIIDMSGVDHKLDQLKVALETARTGLTDLGVAGTG